MSVVIFNIHRGNNINSSPWGSITKIVATAPELITSTDSYEINFPPDGLPPDKLYIFVAGLMIDYQLFEETDSSNDNNNNRNRIHY